MPELALGGYTLDALPVPQNPLGDPVPLVLVKCTPQKIAHSPIRSLISVAFPCGGARVSVIL